MYSIDINLLRDRGYDSQVSEARESSTGNLPLFVGIGAGATLVALVLLAFGVLTFSNQRLAQRQQELETELARIAPNLKRVDQLKAETQQIQAETQALAMVFNQIKPWSVVLQDLRDRTPPALQLAKIQQVAPAATPARATTPQTKSGEAAPPPPPRTSELKISGSALSFESVNDFILALGKSSFLQEDSTKLTTSERKKDNVSGVELVEYQITTTLNDVPASKLLEELSRKGATGLVTRIETLKQKGVLQP